MVTVLAGPHGLLICFCPLIIAMNGSATLTADYAAILAFFLHGLRVHRRRHVRLRPHREPDHRRRGHLCRAAGPLPVGPIWCPFSPTPWPSSSPASTSRACSTTSPITACLIWGAWCSICPWPAVFVFLTVQVLQKRRWAEEVTECTTQRRYHLAGRCWRPSPWWSTWWWGSCPPTCWSLTSRTTSLYTVTDTSVDFLSALERDVELVVLAERGHHGRAHRQVPGQLCRPVRPSSPSPTWTRWPTPPPPTEYDGQPDTLSWSAVPTPASQRVIPFSRHLGGRSPCTTTPMATYYRDRVRRRGAAHLRGETTSPQTTATVLYLAWKTTGRAPWAAQVTDAISKANLYYSPTASAWPAGQRGA